MSKRTSFLLINDILESIRKIKNYTTGLSFEDFKSDDKTIDAVVRNFEIIGEAARKLPDAYREEYSTIPWYKIIGFRNRIVHDYFGVDLKIIWQIVTTQIDELESEIKHLSRF